MSTSTPTAREAVEQAYARIAEADRPELWIALRDQEEAGRAAAAVDAAVAAGAAKPLAGLTVAVKDNVDVAGLPTTAGAPRVLRQPEHSAGIVAALESAGAVVIGKTTLDQFATGLVGTRTPYGVPGAAHDRSLVSGGSSSGSAVAVALGLVDLGIGTDTAGSGRVPAAFNSLIGVKPTLGLVSSDGVFPASPSYDTASIFARTMTVASAAMDVVARTGARTVPTDVPVAPRVHRVGCLVEEQLANVDPAWREAYRASVDALISAGFEVVPFDVQPLLDAALLLYEGALLAERAASFGHDLEMLGDEADPTVAGIVRPASEFMAVDLVRDQQALEQAKRELPALWERVDAILLPSVPGHPTIAEVQAEPVRANARLGTYTNFVNLLDLSALAVPAAGSGPAAPRGVTFVGPAFADLVLARVAAGAGLVGEVPTDASWGMPTVDVVVFGAHRAGQPLHEQLASRGAHARGIVRTAPCYRMVRLDTVPPKPGVWRDENVGGTIVGERWSLSPAAFASFLGDLAWPMAVGPVELDSGETVLGFTCEPGAAAGAEDLTVVGDWLAAPVG
ncbi:allophanate hydrolase [Demequina zhanjiangensis]|uniref:Allophanate hydrolase n=1 Tax=Demequina zhanjiangensis TaxID=3051659 RepID=A0ABT8G0E7_9MICO|nr:allophanate hydrolase [Demequina sp. SYSU T00b26]MDN4472610.1 allophanate hydrolase [Demequina sp. SYSU T00b26]